MIVCPYCHEPAVLVDSKQIYGRNDKNFGKFWMCWPCDAYVGVHKNSRNFAPLGRLADKELRRWKQNAHAAFDPIWTSGKLSRKEAYVYMARLLGLPKESAHIGKFDVDMCKKLVELLCPKVEEK